MGEIIGYARVSSVGQEHEGQVARLKVAGASKVFAEKASGLDKERPEWGRCRQYLREGDTLIITKLDRLARSAADLHGIVEELSQKRVGFKVLDDPSLDTTSRTGKLVFGILASIAEFETALRRERQMEGIARAKAKAEKAGKTYGGRPRLVTDDKVLEILALRREGLSVRQIAAQVGLSHGAVHNAIAADPASGRK